MTRLVCAFTGHRPEKLGFPWDEGEPRYKRLKQKLFCEILQLTRDGVSVFITGMARGVDQLAAEIVLSLKDVVPDRNLQLWAAVPYDRQSLSWSPKDKARYDVILKKADKIEYVSHNYYNGCLLKRNRYMVDNASHLIAVYDENQGGGTKYTVDYARKKGLNITIIEP